MHDTVIIACITAVTSVLIALVGILPPLRALRRQAEATHAQVTNNGGSSLKDAVDRVETKLDQTVARESTFESYVHSRFHDVLNLVQGVEGKIALHRVEEHNLPPFP